MKTLLKNTSILIAMIICLSFSSGASAGSSQQPLDDPWIMFCLIAFDPGKDLTECLELADDNDDRGMDKLVVTKEDSQQSYFSLITRISDDSTSIDAFKQSSRTFEFVDACGIHFSSGEHPISIRCRITNESLGVFNPDVVLSVSWNKLIWNTVDDIVEHGNPAVCAVAFNLDQIPAGPEINAQQVVEEFNQSPSCGAAGLTATYKTAPAGTFIDINFSPQNKGEMSIPGPNSIGTLTY